MTDFDQQLLIACRDWDDQIQMLGCCAPRYLRWNFTRTAPVPVCTARAIAPARPGKIRLALRQRELRDVPVRRIGVPDSPAAKSAA